MSRRLLLAGSSHHPRSAGAAPYDRDHGRIERERKIFFREESLPANTQRPGQIHTSDLMLCGSDCLVLFYESFSSSYPYTTPGQINDPDGLSFALVRDSVEVTFQTAP